MKKLWAFGISGTRWFLGMTFFTAGMSKLMPFIGWIGPTWLIERLEEYQLGMYARFIAISQVLIGLLLLTRRFATLGAVMLVPMLLNIFMITVSQNWAGTPYIIAVLLLMNAALLADEYPRLRLLLGDDPRQLPTGIPLRRQPGLDGAWGASFAVFMLGVVLVPYISWYQWLLGAGGLGFVGLSLYSLRMRWRQRSQLAPGKATDLSPSA
ncbi:hypothetical protein [Cesiribacter andamanensis]|uniref:DoxX n=1 Tax=Cesiribacter andamanensis AMV16 TaxID=1279009 RepID=M7N133_9BACT|nr:hypothetical protein [Cesiribacter andamanensis]EMR00921.1 hypothetical protein ADICEAN_03950 [Cesiribacter andamanensis AMV16]